MKYLYKFAQRPFEIEYIWARGTSCIKINLKLRKTLEIIRIKYET